MQCPYCESSKIRVVDKRASEEKAIRRRRECLKCNKRFTTYERIETHPLVVIKHDGRREPFNRDKLSKGIALACGKRPISQEDIEKTVDEIEADLRNMDSNEIKSRAIGELAMGKLKSLDEVAYIRFASVYRQFKGIEHFEKELKELKKR
ncbi:MAG: transcriptional repressor NrdR [Candidatus Aenigmarchaeota archaeon]|nr:transcriptional repressor NrdR [Candidatus Aenigmarchaeota archaeon]